jgi:hypothetical protein
VAAILALLFVPPFVSISRYKGRITQLMSASLGRPVRLSSVELRMLPRPGFVLTDLVVEEDAPFGAEPVMRAETVTASVRLWPLWRGRLEISRISVDNASVNLVHSPNGHWNLDSLFRSATVRPDGSGSRAIELPYMEATNSRLNIKNGVEKLPFSLVDAEASLWQESSGEWRVRMRGQPARTDVSLDLPDTGEVRLEATLGRSPQLQQMPLRIDIEWREAQLGQLSRLLLGSDEGWRGDLTGEMHVIGTAETAQVKTRLRASGVHRAEFAPAAPLDFDATCSFTAHSMQMGLGNLVCDSPIGNGRARLTGDIPQGSEPPHLTLELDHAPAQVALDGLRTLRSNLDPNLEAAGTVSGKMTYEPDAVPIGPEKPVGVKGHPLPPVGPLSGVFVAEGVQLSGDGLAKPLQIGKFVLEPAPFQQGQQAELVATMVLPAGGREPVSVSARIALSGYQTTVHGAAAMSSLRELAHLAGIPEIAGLYQFMGDAVELDLHAEGPWMAPSGERIAIENGASPEQAPESAGSATDKISGTVTLRNANWKSGFLANPVAISLATLHLDGGKLRWDPVDFSYGPISGIATLEWGAACEPGKQCPPRFTVRFGALDGPVLQSAILGAHEPGTLLSTLIDKFRSSPPPGWPPAEGTVHADSLGLELVTLTNVSGTISVLPSGAEISSLDASVLGGLLHASGTLTVGDKPTYKLQGKLEKLNPGQVGQLCGMHWSGGFIAGDGTVEASGFTDKDLAASATGRLNFDWRHGSVTSDPSTIAPPVLARFDRWSGSASIAQGTVSFAQSQVEQGSHKTPMAAELRLGYPPKVGFHPGKASQSSKR